MGVKVTGQFEPAGDFSIVDGKDVSGNITGSNISASGTVYASQFTGDGSALTGVVSGTDISGSWQGHLSSSKVTFGGDIRVAGDVVAERYVVSSSVTHLTQSFSSGSTIFGDTIDDTHQFTGSLFVSNSLAINSTGRGPIDVKGSTGTMGFYLHELGTAVYLPSDIAHSGGGSGFDIQARNYRLGTSTGGPVSIYPRFDAQLNLGTTDDADLLVLSGSTKISGSEASTGSFGSGYINNTLNVGPDNSTHTGFALDVSGSGASLLQLKSSDKTRMEFKMGSGMGSGVAYIQKYDASGTERNRFYLGNSTDFYSKGSGGTIITGLAEGSYYVIIVEV